MLQKIQNVRSVFNDAQNKFWPIQWKISKILNKRVKADEEYQAAASAIDVAFSQLRNSLLWSAITEYESSIYGNLFPTTEDKWENVLTKLKQSEEWLLIDINSITNTYWLPSVNMQQALNPSLRYVLYKSSQDVFD
jgi:hypothetical protein